MVKRMNGLTENEFDTLVLVKGLVEHGWSYNKVAEVISKHHTTVKSLYEKALELHNSGRLAKTATCERTIRLQYVGGTQEIEEIERGQIERQSGRRPTGHRSDD